MGINLAGQENGESQAVVGSACLSQLGGLGR